MPEMLILSQFGRVSKACYNAKVTFFRKFPLEVYVLLVPSFLIIAVCFTLSFFNSRLDPVVFSHLFVDSIFLVFFGESFSLVLKIVVIVGLVLSFIVGTFFILRKANRAYLFSHLHSYEHILQKYAFVFLSVTIPTAAIMMSLNTLFSLVGRDRVAKVSAEYMKADHAIFGLYPSFWLQRIGEIPWLEWFVLFSYQHVFLFLGLTFLLLFFVSKKLFQKFLFSFFILYVISFFIWALFPAISPQEMYRKNILHREIPQAIQHEIDSTKPTVNLQSYLNELDAYWISTDNTFLSVSTNPSLHAAWALLIVIFLFRWKKIAGVILTPWFIGTILATLYTFQHYAVDLIVAVIVAVLAVRISEFLCAK